MPPPWDTQQYPCGFRGVQIVPGFGGAKPFWYEAVTNLSLGAAAPEPREATPPMPETIPSQQYHSTTRIRGRRRAAILLVSATIPGVAVGQDRPAELPPQDPIAERTSAETKRESQPQDAPGILRFDNPLDPVVITATRSDRRLFDIPAIGDLITSDEIGEAMYRTVPDALRDVPGIMIQKTGHGQGSPYIRGFTGFRNLFMIDGVRLNNSVFRDGPNQYWNTVDPYSIDRLEIIKGPSSVLYGSDAIGGTINAFTKGPNTYGQGSQTGGRGYYRGATAERSHTFRAEISTTWEHELGFHAGGTYKNFGDLESGAGTQHKTGYDEYDGDFKAEYFIAETTRLVIAHQRINQNDAWRTHKTIFGESYEGTTVGNERRRSLDQNRELTYLQLHAEDLDALIDTMRLNVSYQSQREERDRIRNDGRRDIQGFDADTIGAWAQFESDSPIGRWTYGAEFYRDYVDSYRRDYDAAGNLTAVHVQGPIADDSMYDLLGVYLQNEYAVNDSLELILGGRYTYASVDADAVEDPVTGNRFSISDDYEALVGSARFLYRIDQAERWNLFGGVSQGFRTPNLSDLTRLDTARSTEIETPSPGLDPERFIAYEIGLKTRYDNFSAQASYHYTDIEDMIIRQPTGAIVDGANEVTKRNSGDGFVHGVEIEARYRFDEQWSTFGWFAWMEGEVDTFPTAAPNQVREPIDRLMPAMGQIGLRWDAPKRDVWLEGLVTLAADADRLSTRDEADTDRIPAGGTPGYAVLTLRSGWRIDENFTLTAALENLTDENYRVHGSGVNEPGINLILGLEYKF